MEASTLVNTAASSVLDLTSGLQKVIELTLYSHPIFQYYENVNLNHSIANKKNALIEENIWPHLTGHTLVGPDKINLRSRGLYVIDEKFLTEFEDIDELQPDQHNHSYTFFHLGSKLSGHTLIIHGGLLATILDELTCRLAFQSFESKKGVTANLQLNYFKPCFVDSYVMLKCTLLDKKGRKCRVKGQVFLVDLKADLEGKPVPEFVEDKANLLTECICLVIEPKWVNELNNTRH